jgi:NADPH2:quinone reductase
MKAAYIEQTGPPEVIRWGDVQTPEPGPTQVLVRTGAVAVNPIDTYIRNGANYWALPQPFIVGCDIAGTVEAVGSDVSRFRVGDRVWGSNQGLMGRQGSFAEFCCSDEEWLYPTPETVSDENAAAIALVGITAHLGLFHRAQLRAGDSVFVQGGSGGVGSTVVQMAKAAGARVIASAGTPEKAELCKRLGADAVVQYRTEDVAAAVEQFAPGGVNVFWETRREPDFDAIVPCVAERARIILMAGRDARPPFPVGPFYVKGCSLLGFVMFKATPDEQRTCSADISRWLADGSLRPRIDRVMPLADTAEAHRLQEQATVHHAAELAGKIVLTP